MPYADSDGVRLHYQEAGNGPAIIFAHELASDTRQWRGQMERFSRRFRCVAYDARGYPPSDVPEDEAAYGYQRFVADIGAVREALGLDQVFIVGWSMGAYAALLYALEHPDHVKGVAAAGVGSGSPADEIEGFRADMRALAGAYEAGGAEAGAGRIAAGANRQPLRRNRPEAWAAFFADLQSHSAAGMARVCRNYQGGRPSLMEFADGFARSTVPTLLIVGDEDAACLRTSRWLAEVIPDAELVIMPGVGHAPNLEEPDAFDSVLESFLDRVQTGGGREALP